MTNDTDMVLNILNSSTRSSGKYFSPRVERLIALMLLPGGTERQPLNGASALSRTGFPRDTLTWA